MQTSPVAVPGIFLADGAAASTADRGHSLRSLDSATGGAPIAPLVPLRSAELNKMGNGLPRRCVPRNDRESGEKKRSGFYLTSYFILHPVYIQ